MRTSDINEVQRLADTHNIGEIFPSTRKHKKYMIRDKTKTIHFGDNRYEDFTIHHDLKRRDNFRKRNAKWKDASKNSPAWLSYHLLW